MKAALLFALACLMASCGLFSRKVDDAEKEAPKEIVESEPVATSIPDMVTSIPEDFTEYTDVEEDRAEEIENLGAIMSDYPELENWRPFNGPYGVFHMTGNFFGDREDDLAIVVQNINTDIVRVCIINNGAYGAVLVIFGEDEYDDGNDPGGSDWSWIGEFEKVDRGEILFSNYEDDFRSLDEVPENERVVLDHDAIFVQVHEACGGGFVFWNNGQFNWLQQE